MIQVTKKRGFIKEATLAKKRGLKMWKIEYVINCLASKEPLPEALRNHKLQGKYNGLWECHIAPDWLLIYEKTKDEIILTRTGTHSDLF